MGIHEAWRRKGQGHSEDRLVCLAGKGGWKEGVPSLEGPGLHLWEAALGAEPGVNPLPLGGEGRGQCPPGLLAGACIYWQEMLSTPGGERGRGTLLLGYFFIASGSAVCCESLSPMARVPGARGKPAAL